MKCFLGMDGMKMKFKKDILLLDAKDVAKDTRILDGVGRHGETIVVGKWDEEALF